MNVSLKGEIKLTQREQEILQQAGKLAQTIAVHRPGIKPIADELEERCQEILIAADTTP